MEIENKVCVCTPQMDRMRRRELFVDLLRFTAILLVTAFHVARWLGYENLTFLNAVNTVFKEGNYTGVCLFFAISGYCHVKTWREGNRYLHFILGRLARLAPAYYVAIAIWACLVSIGIAVKPIGAWHLLSHVFFLHVYSADTFYSVSGVFWYLGVLMQFYVLSPLLRRLCERRVVGWSVAIVSFCVCLVLSKQLHLTNPVFTRSALFYLPSFMVGMMFAKHPIVIQQRFAKVAVIALSIVLFFTRIPYCDGIALQIKPLALFFGAMQFEGCLHGISQWAWRPVSVVASASFSIYLYNYIYLVSRPVLKCGMVFLCYVAFVVGVGIVMYLLVEQPFASFVARRRES